MDELKQTLINKKLNNWNSNLDDFRAERELTVEITLSEYRELIISKATKDADINEANKDKYTREDENRELKKKNKELEFKLFEYRKKFGDLEENNENEEVEED